MTNETSTLPYIPGSALRGMLAEAYLDKGEKADDDFRQLFCEDEVCFPNLYPSRTRPIPLSAYSCKADGGFRNDDREPGELSCHAIWDLLFEDDGSYSGDRRRRCMEVSRCGGSPLKPWNGFYDGADPTPKTVDFTTLLVTRTAISPKTQSALEASLHTKGELTAGQEFYGLLSSADETSIESLEGALGCSVTSYVGQHHAGRVEISIEPIDVDPPKPSFLGFPHSNGFVYFALTLLSYAILIDRLLRPVITFTPDILRNQVGLPSDVNVEVVKAFCATRMISGWSSVARIFKPNDLALVAGSTFLLKSPDSKKAEIGAWMQSVIDRGVGLRRSEGFGQVCFDEPMHTAAARLRGGPL